MRERSLEGEEAFMRETTQNVNRELQCALERFLGDTSVVSSIFNVFDFENFIKERYFRGHDEKA